MSLTSKKRIVSKKMRSRIVDQYSDFVSALNEIKRLDDEVSFARQTCKRSIQLTQKMKSIVASVDIMSSEAGEEVHLSSHHEVAEPDECKERDSRRTLLSTLDALLRRRELEGVMRLLEDNSEAIRKDDVLHARSADIYDELETSLSGSSASGNAERAQAAAFLTRLHAVDLGRVKVAL